MTQEIQAAVSLNLSNAGCVAQLSGTATVTQTAQGIKRVTVNAGTSDATVDLTGLTTPGYIFMQNLDGTNYIDVGPGSGTYFTRLLPGGPPQLMYLVAGGAIHFKCAAGMPKLDITILEH